MNNLVIGLVIGFLVCFLLFIVIKPLVYIVLIGLAVVGAFAIYKKLSNNTNTSAGG